MRFSLAGSSLPPGLRARCARFPTCGVIRVAGYSVVWDCDPTPHISLKSTKRSAAAISRSQRSFITFHGALRNILLSAGFPAMFHMIALEQTFVNNSLQKIFLLLLPFQIESILSAICLSFLRWIFQRWKIQFRKKRTAVFSHPPIRPMPHPHLQTNPDYPRRDLLGCHIRRVDRSSRGSCRRFGFEMGYLVCAPADDKLSLSTPYRSSIPDFAAPRSEPPRFQWLPQIPDRDSRQRGSALQTYTLAVQRVREVVDALPEEDAALLRALYLQTPPLTLRAYSEKTGIPVMTLHYRKEKLLRLLKQQI